MKKILWFLAVIGSFFALLCQAGASWIADTVNDTASGATADATSILSGNMWDILIWVFGIVLVVLVIKIVFSVVQHFRQ